MSDGLLLLADGEENLDSRTVQVEAVKQPEYLQREIVIGTRVTDDSVEQRACHGRTAVSETVVSSVFLFAPQTISTASVLSR